MIYERLISEVMKISPLTLFLCSFLFYFHLSYSNQSLIQPGAILILMGMEGEWMGMVSKGPETTRNNREKWHFNKVVSPSLGSPLWWETLLIHTNLFFFSLLTWLCLVLVAAPRTVCCSTQTLVVVCRLRSRSMRAPEWGQSTCRVWA